MEGEPVYVRVLYHFDYTTKDTRMVSIRQGEKLELLKQTNPDWWQVRRDFNSKPFYVPAAYVREIPPPFISPLINPPPVKSNPYKDRNTKIVKNEFQTKHIQKVDYTNFQNIQPTTDTPRHTIEASLRKELIHGNFKLKPCENNNNNKKSSDKLQDNTSLSYQSRLGNLVKDIKVQQKVSFDNRGVGTSVSPPSSVSFQPSTQERVSRSYSVVTPIVPKKPVPCPRLKELSKSLETLAEEIQFIPSNNKNSSDSIWKNGETSDYHTPSPDYLDSDMFWKKSTSPQDDTNAASSSNVQRSSSFRFTRWPSRKKKRERKRAALGQTGDACSEDDSGASRSLESLVDSGAEACSSSSYEWDRSGEGSEGATTPKRVPPLAFRNFTYRSTDDDSDADEGARPRSVSDTAVNLQPNLQSSDSQSSPGDTVSSRSESHISDQPKPLVALKRNQKLVGCRRRPALLCIPSSSNNNNERSKSARRNKEVYLPRAPRCPPSPAPHEKPLRVLPGGWAEFYCSDAGGAGRIFYFHAITGERSWKPPRTRRSAGDGQPAEGEEGSAREDGSSTRSRSQSPAAETTPVPLVLPPGWEERYDDEAEQNCYFHKDSGAKAAVTKDVPGSVARWLNELRRDTDSTEIDEELRLRVECEAVASEVELLPSPPPSKQRAPQDLMMVHDIVSITEDTPPPKQDNVWNHNPVFKSINKEEKTTKTGEQCNKKSSFKSLCSEARRASETLIRNSSGSEYTDCKSCSTVSVKGVDLVSIDLELEQLSERALSIADEALAECANERAKARMAGAEVAPSRARSTSAASELSDDVFFSISSSASLPSDINTIFDNGAGESPPVAPPRRKKPISPTSDSKESKEIFQQIEIFTSKAIEKNLDMNTDNNLISTKTMIKSNNTLPEKPSIPQRPVIFDSSKMFLKDSKLTQKVNDDKQRSNNQVTKDEIEGNKAAREDKTSRLQPEGREEQPSSGLSDNDSEICDPVFAQRFSLQIVDRQTYYPEIQRNNRLTVPQLSQEVQALYLDEANSIGDQKNQSSSNNKSIKEENHESVTTTATTKLENTSISSNKKEVLESIKDSSLLKNQNNNTELLSMNKNYSTTKLEDLNCAEKVAETEPPREDVGSLSGDMAGEESNWSQLEAEESFRSRKGSFSSDIVAWKQELLQQWDRLEDDEEPAYTAGPQPEEWFSSSDREGRLYFFEENSNESSWTLPDDVDQPAPSTPTPTTPTNKGPDKTKRQTSAVSALVAAVDARQGSVAERRPLGPAFEAGSRSTIAATLLHAQHSDDEDDEDSRTSPHVRARLPPGALLLPAYQQLARGNKTRSMVIEAKRVPSDETVAKTASIPRNWPQLLEAGMAVLKEGVLHKTKITENGKKLRKNWAPSHVVLTELLLLFFRDAKSFQAMRSGNVTGSKPELCVDLNGAAVESADKLSSRKNVFVVSTALGLQVLCQEENVSAADSWFYQLGLAIKNLGGGCNTTPRIKLLPTSREPSPLQQEPSPEEVRAASIGRSRSVKIKKDMGSVEDLSASPTEQTKIKDRLKKFFVRRPTMESLVKKGIWKDEPAFGCYLGKLCMDESLQVPVFVQRCIAAIEGKPENLKTDGLYRASGNLSQVQKIRLQVDQNNLSVLDQEEDVHVLTGALKLFFRELKEPLIPFDAFNKALKASTNPNKKEKLQHFREIVRHLPGPNHDTLQFLLQHLLRVTEQQASNRMHIPNLAIVFGPTLMWPEQESLNMALDLMQQNIVIESLLLDYDNIFR